MSSEGLLVLGLFSFDEAGLFDNNSWEFNALATPGIEKIKINNVVRNLRMRKYLGCWKRKLTIGENPEASSTGL